jgi:spore coat polysaccharide biosynthesis protein SpsF
MTTFGIIQARMTSSRLPGKVLAPIAGLPLLAVLWRRLQTARCVDEWWLATTLHPADDVLASWGAVLGMKVHRGDDEDVLNRFAEVVRRSPPRWVVRLTSDNPFTDGAVVDRLLRAAIESDTGNVDVWGESPVDRQTPLGYTPQVVRADALVALDSSLPEGSPHRAHVLTAFYERERFAAVSVCNSAPSRPNYRWTVDTREDLIMAQKAFECFGERWPVIGLVEMVETLDVHPEVVGLNAAVRQRSWDAG